MADKLQLVQMLADSGTRYRETALEMPRVLINDTVQHMNVITGLRGEEVEPAIVETGNYKPYKTEWNPQGAQPIQARKLVTHHLQYESEFDPEPLMRTVFGKPTDKIPMLTNEMVKKIAIAKMKSCSEGLNQTIWQGERDENATDTLSNFDGFATIIRKERAAGAISLTAGNLATIGGINVYNAGLKLQTIWNRRCKKIKRATMFIEDMIFSMYDQWYRNQNYNNANTNTDGVQQFLIGTEKKCKLVTCEGMEGMGYIILTDGKKNMKVGMDGIGTGEDATGTFQLFSPGNPKVVGMFTDCWMGVNFTRIDKEFLMTASYNIKDDSVYATVDPEEAEFIVVKGTTKTVEIEFQGYNLTTSVAVSVSGEGFTCETSTVTAVNANTEGGVKVTISFVNATAGTYIGLVRFASATDDVDLTAKITAIVTES